MGTTFAGDAIFSNSKFDDIIDFTGAAFKGRSNFTGTIFNGDTSIWGVTFARESIFHNVAFKCGVSFRRAKLPYDISFMGSLFLNDVDFWEAEFKSNPKRNEVNYFLNAKFNPSPYVRLFFPKSIMVDSEGLPEGAKWITFDILEDSVQSND